MSARSPSGSSPPRPTCTSGSAALEAGCVSFRSSRMIFRRINCLRGFPPCRSILYLLFTEGYLSSHADGAIRRELCDEAIRLTQILSEHPVSAVPETFALLALMHLHSCTHDGSSGSDLGDSCSSKNRTARSGTNARLSSDCHGLPGRQKETLSPGITRRRASPRSTALRPRSQRRAGIGSSNASRSWNSSRRPRSTR